MGTDTENIVEQTMNTKVVRSCVDVEIKAFVISFMVGLVAFLIANTTNPYLGKFDYMWVIFIPVMFIHTYKLEKRRSKIDNT